MESSALLNQFTWTLIEQLPSLITLVICMVFVVTRWKKYSKIAPMALIGLALIFIHSLFFAVVYTWVPGFFLNRTGLESTNLFLIIGLINNIALAIALAPLLAAIFMRRNPAQP